MSKNINEAVEKLDYTNKLLISFLARIYEKKETMDNTENLCIELKSVEDLLNDTQKRLQEALKQLGN